MVKFSEIYVGAAPLLVAEPDQLSPPYPTVLWFHGLRVDKETHRAELERLANEGFLAVGVDAAGHGKRRMPDLEQRFDPPREVIEPLLFALVSETAAEVPGIFNGLIHDGLADPQRLGVCGISMGALIAYGAIVRDRRIRAAVSILGDPHWRHGDSPHHHRDRFFPTALLSINAEKDSSVPPGPARDFHDRLRSEYRSDPERLRYEEIRGAEHALTEEQWKWTIDQAVAWFRRFLTR